MSNGTFIFGRQTTVKYNFGTTSVQMHTLGLLPARPKLWAYGAPVVHP